MSDIFQYKPGKTAVIRNIVSGLCLDAAGDIVTIQYFNGSPSQLWSFEPVGEDKYMLRNSGNKDVLDVECDAESGTPLTTFEAHGAPSQQWYINHDNTITNALGNWAIDIYEGKCWNPGQSLIVYEKHGLQNQQFTVQYQWRI